MGLLRTIVIILAAYLLLRLLSRWLAPKIFGYAAKKAEQRLREMYGMPQGRSEAENQPSGNISFDKKTKKRAGDSEKVGEYIEFEEIE